MVLSGLPCNHLLTEGWRKISASMSRKVMFASMTPHSVPSSYNGFECVHENFGAYLLETVCNFTFREEVGEHGAISPGHLRVVLPGMGRSLLSHLHREQAETLHPSFSYCRDRLHVLRVPPAGNSAGLE